MRSWIATALLLFPAMVAAQLPRHPHPFAATGDTTKPNVFISPSTYNGASAQVAVSVGFGDACGFSTSPVITLNGQNVTSQFTFKTTGTSGPQCTGYSQTATGTLTLRSGADTVMASVANLNHLPGADTVEYTYTPFVAMHRLRVWVAAGAMHAAPNTTASVAFTVTNIGNTTDTVYTKNHCFGYGLVPHCYTVPDSAFGLAPGGVYSGTMYVSVSDSVGQVGRLETIAYEKSHAGVTDTGYTDITVQNPLGPGVVLNTVTPDVTRPRDKCLTIEIQPGIAYQCGDLRVVHDLPATRTYNKVRTPAFIYNSIVANGVYAIGALLTFNSSMGTPDTVRATITDSATGIIIGTNTWPGKYWVNGATQRVTVRANELGNESGARFAYTFTATGVYVSQHTTQSYSATAAQISTSQANGPGFEHVLAGQEYLVIPQWLGATPWTSTKPLYWSNSEGDTRQYNPVPGDSLVWASVGVDRPDTIKMFNTATQYGAYRYAEHGTIVRFDPHGPELEVIDRLGDSTRLVDTSLAGDPDSYKLVIPTPGGGLSYTLAMGGYHPLDSVIAPAVSGQSRTVHFKYDTLNLYKTTIIDPDGSSVVYTWLNGQPHLPGYNLMTSYQNKYGTITRFYYDSAFKLVKAIVDSGAAYAMTPNVPALNITWTFQPAESRGYTTPVAPDSAYTLVGGPRSNQSCTFPFQPCPDSADVTRFWVDQWGEPYRIRDAHGDEIELTRGNPTYPSLVTYVRYQNGRVVIAGYDRRGNPDSTIDSSFSINGTYATTHYTFDQKFDFVTEISRPAGEIVTFAYDQSTGNRLWQQPGTDTARKVNFNYYPSDSVARGLLQSIVTPVESPLATTVTYDHTLANEASVTTPLGITTSTTRDAIGRSVVVYSPIDDTDTRTDTTLYDAMDRAYYTSSNAPALTHNFDNADTLIKPYVPQLQPRTASAAALSVTTTYDADGNPQSIVRSASPDLTSIGSMRTDFAYDSIGRLIQKTQFWGLNNTDSASDLTAYDAAGNAVWLVTRRSDTIRVTFDALNRIVRRLLPAKEYARDTNSLLRSWGMTLPAYSNCSDGTGFCISADTATFGYDRVGHTVIANNGDAWISRIYLQNGDLAADTERVRGFANEDFTQHVYGITYTYDLDGRRLTMTHPSTVAPVNGGGVQLNTNSYTYDPDGVGELTVVTDVFGNPFQYQYDLDGRVNHLDLSQSAAVQHWAYDADSRLIVRIDSTPNTVLTNGWQYNELHHDTLSYDLRGDIVQVLGNAPAQGLRIFNAYSGLGALDDALMYNLNWPKGGFPTQANEQFTVADGFGNAFGTFNVNGVGEKTYSDSANSYARSVYESGSGRLLASGSFGSGSNYFANFSNLAYDSSGNLVRTLTSRSVTSAVHIDIGQDQYYDAAQHLRAVDKHFCYFDGNACQDSAYQSFSDIAYMQQYRYDALGRRILVVTFPRASCNLETTVTVFCLGYIERPVYDGDQLLYEIRMPNSPFLVEPDQELDTGAVASYEGTANQYGRVIYTHGLGLDEPVDIIRVGYDTLYPGPNQIMPLPDWRGGYDAGVLASGAEHVCTGQLLPDSVFQTTPGLCFNFYGMDPQFGVYHQDLFLSIPGILFTPWHGSLAAGRRDVTNQIYLRNRYYDPQTGRFTQEDPLGLAGGLNAYGFGGGDPVDYSDPFGLCTPPDSPICQVAAGIAQRTAGLTDVVNAVGEATGVNGLGRAVDDVRSGDVASAAVNVALSVPVVPGEGAAVMGSKAAVRGGLEALKLSDKVLSGVRGVLSSGRADQVLVRAAEDGGATVTRWVKGSNTVSSAMYHYIIDNVGHVVGGAKQAYDKAGAIAGTFKIY